MSTAIQPRESSGIQIHSLEEAMNYARAIAAAGLAPEAFRNKPANVLIAREIAGTLQEATWTVMSELNVIKGRPSFSAKFMRSRVRQAGHRLRESYDDGVARCVIIRADDPEFEHVATWDRAKAEAHGLWGERHWLKNPELMLKNRALSECVREACYEVMGGVGYTPDEVMDFADDSYQQHRPATHRMTASRAHPQATQQHADPRGQHRTGEEILADLDPTDATSARELWREARAAGLPEVCDQIRDAITASQQPTGNTEVHDAEIVEDTPRRQDEDTNGFVEEQFDFSVLAEQEG